MEGKEETSQRYRRESVSTRYISTRPHVDRVRPNHSYSLPLIFLLRFRIMHSECSLLHLASTLASPFLACAPYFLLSVCISPHHSRNSAARNSAEGGDEERSRNQDITLASLVARHAGPARLTGQ